MLSERFIKLLGCALMLALLAIYPAGVASAQVSTFEFVTQQVCLGAGGAPSSADPITCPLASQHRLLQPGEPLPYHKIDYLGIQISDSYPVSDPLGVTRAVQTYFYVSDINADSRFPNTVHFNPFHGGYNIIGADSNSIYFRGTFDQTGGWQPWWTSDCHTRGWILAPNGPGYSPAPAGSASSPTDKYPSCPGTVGVASSTVEWDNYNYTYATSKTLNSIVSTHWAPSYGAAERIFLTREYGVSRWEAWLPGTNNTLQGIKDQCPNISYNQTMHGTAFYLADCHDWTTITTSYAPWNPAGRSSVDSNLLNWPVDPLYYSGNLLSNTHIGGPYSYPGNPTCYVGAWDRVNSPAVLNWAWDSSSGTLPHPFNTNGLWPDTGNCTLIWSTPGPIGGQALYQVASITPGNTGTWSFGAMLWAPDYVSGTKPHVIVRVFQRASNGSLISYSDIDAELTNIPATFASSFSLNAATASLTLTFYPTVAGVNHEMTGAWIAPRPSTPVGL